MKAKYNYILGSLVGFAIGDAMGATTEFLTEDEIKAAYGKVDNIIGGGWLHLNPGEVTDDTEMMIAVADACLHRDPEPNRRMETFLKHCCDNFVNWYKGHPKDVGGACREAIVKGMGKSPQEWMKASADRQKAYQTLGNGSVMRALYPILLGSIQMAVAQGKLTHNNAITTRGIKYYFMIIHEALSGIALPQNIYLMEPSGHVKNTVNNAVYWASTTDNFRDAILGAVNHGGDADTIAALTGGIVGAKYGIKGIPEEWIHQLDKKVLGQLISLAIKAC